MNTSAQPADQRASATFGTVKKRMMTCGRPAVPIISDSVNSTMLSVSA
jgi:UDP-N-acetylmuramyl pentapeptide synthase